MQTTVLLNGFVVSCLAELQTGQMQSLFRLGKKFIQNDDRQVSELLVALKPFGLT